MSFIFKWVYCVLFCFALAACGRSEQNPAPANTPVAAADVTANTGVALAAVPERITALGVIRSGKRSP